jgi:hypothetical protein
MDLRVISFLAERPMGVMVLTIQASLGDAVLSTKREWLLLSLEFDLRGTLGAFMTNCTWPGVGFIII